MILRSGAKAGIRLGASVWLRVWLGESQCTHVFSSQFELVFVLYNAVCNGTCAIIVYNTSLILVKVDRALKEASVT